MKTRNHTTYTLTILAMGMLAIVAAPQSVSAVTLLTDQHVDIGVAGPDGLELHWHVEGGAEEYEPGEAEAYIHPELARVTVPGGSTYSFTGVAPGQDLWLLPQTQNTDLLYLGIGAEEAVGVFDAWNPGDSRGANLSAAWVEISLVSVSGPGEFSVWANGSFGNPVVMMSTFAPPAEGNHLFIIEGGHAHYNWGFTELGTYDVTFQLRGFIDGKEVFDEGTLRFTSVPEPGSALLMGAGICALTLWRRRRQSTPA